MPTLEGMIQTLVRNDSATFLHYLSFLTDYDHDMMILYHVLGHRQEDTAKIMGKTQTVISSLTRAALRKMAFYIDVQGPANPRQGRGTGNPCFTGRTFADDHRDVQAARELHPDSEALQLEIIQPVAYGTGPQGDPAFG